MPSTYTVNLGIEKPATGEQSGTWGDTTNVNFDILDQAINGAERVTLTSAGSSGSPNALQITNGATSDGRNKWIEFYSSGDLGGSVYVQLDPNDAEKIVFVRNSLASSRSILLFQGTYNSGRDLEIPAGVDMVVKFDGGGASAATVTDVYTKLRATEITTPTLTAGTADINGGTFDSSVIGGASAAAITGTTVVANTSLNIAGDGATVTGIKDEDNMASNSATKLATQQSIKAYVDAQVGTVDTWAEVLANGATSGSTNPEVTAGQALKTNTINETSAGSGVTIDSVLLKDDVVNATDVETGSISANDGTAAATIANSTGNFTITNFISNSVDIGGGAIDGTVIGGASAAAGSFTTLDASGAFTGTTATLSTADNSTQLTLISTDADASAGPVLKLYRNSGTPADSDQTGQIKFTGRNDNNQDVDYARIITQIKDASDTSEDGRFAINTMSAGDIYSRINIIETETAFNDESQNVDFRVESDGNANMLFVDGGEDHVNIGTTSDFGDTFNVSGTGHFSSNVTLSRQTNDTGSTGLIFEKTRSTSVNGNTVVQNGDQLGYVKFAGNDGDQFIDGAYVISFVDGTPGNNDMPASLQFWTTADGASSPTARMVINNKGSVGIGVADGDVTSDGTAARTYVGIIGTANRGRLNIGSTASNGADSGVISFVNGANEIGNINMETNSGSQTVGKMYISSTDVVDVRAAGGVIFNENSADVDFRVESNNNANMIRVDGGNDRVGIGESTPTKTLSVLGDAIIKNTVDGTYLTLHSTQANNASGPDIVLFRDSSSPADDDPLSTIFYQGRNSAGAIKDYMKVRSYIKDVTDGTEDFGMDIQVMTSGNAVNALDILPSELVINNASVDRDFRVESDSNANALFVDAGLSHVGINRAANSVVGLTVNSTQTSSSYYAFEASDSSSQSRFVVRSDGQSDFFDGNNANTLRIGIAGAETVFNDGSTDKDFRVESDDNANMFFIDGNENQIGIGTNSNVDEARVQVEVATTSPNAGSRTANSALMVSGGTTTVGEGPVIALRNISGSKESITMLCTETASGNNGDFTISIYDGGATIPEVARLTSSGSMGLGTSAPIALDGNAEPGLTIASNGPFICLQDANNADKVNYIANNTGVLQFGHVGDNGASGKTENMSLSSNGAVFNEGHADALDFRVESDTNSDGFFIDAGNNEAHFGTSTSGGDISNTFPLSVGRISTAAGHLSTTSGVTTTLLTFPSNAGNFLVTARGSGTGATTDNTTGIVHINNSASTYTVLAAGSRVVLSMSGLNLQVNQTMFTGANVSWSVVRLSI